MSGRIAQRGRETTFAPFLEDIKGFLQTGDIVFGNLEAPLIDTKIDNALFAAPAKSIELLIKGGFTIINLANNHIYDHGPAGLQSTLEILEKAGMRMLGAGPNQTTARQPVIDEVHGVNIGWLGCGRTGQNQAESGPNFWELEKSELIGAVSTLRDGVDVLVVSLHLGLMYLDYPDPDHRALAHRLIDAGADLVLMHHAHVLQGIEIHQGRGIICYNLGNFLVDWNEGYVASEIMVDRQREGAVFVFDIDAEGIYEGSVLPTYIDDDFHVRWATGERGRDIVSRLERISNDLKSDYVPAFDRQRVERNARHAVNVLWFHLRHGNVRYVLEGLKSFRPKHFGLLWRWLSRKT